MVLILLMKLKKTFKYQESPPEVSDLNEARTLINKLWGELQHFEDKLSTSSKNSSKPPSSDGAKERAERKKLKALVIAIREVLNSVT